MQNNTTNNKEQCIILINILLRIQFRKSYVKFSIQDINHSVLIELIEIRNYIYLNNLIQII